MTDAGATFGRLVRERRAARGWSQRALARAAKVTPAYVSLIEHGQRLPDRSVVERLAAALCDDAAGRDALLLAAGYAPAEPPAPPPPAVSPVLLELDRILADPKLSSRQRAMVEPLVLAYAAGLAARAKEGRPLVVDISAPWQARVLETLQEQMTADFERFRDAYLHRLFDS